MFNLIKPTLLLLGCGALLFSGCASATFNEEVLNSAFMSCSKTAKPSFVGSCAETFVSQRAPNSNTSSHTTIAEHGQLLLRAGTPRPRWLSLAHAVVPWNLQASCTRFTVSALEASASEFDEPLMPSRSRMAADRCPLGELASRRADAGVREFPVAGPLDVCAGKAVGQPNNPGDQLTACERLADSVGLGGSLAAWWRDDHHRELEPAALAPTGRPWDRWA